MESDDLTVGGKLFHNLMCCYPESPGSGNCLSSSYDKKVGERGAQ